MSSLISVLQIVGALIVVISVIVLAAKLAQRAQARFSSDLMQVHGRTALSRDSSIAIVEIGGRALVLGITQSSVRLIKDLPVENLNLDLPTTSTAEHLADEPAVTFDLSTRLSAALAQGFDRVGSAWKRRSAGQPETAITHPMHDFSGADIATGEVPRVDIFTSALEDALAEGSLHPDTLSVQISTPAAPAQSDATTPTPQLPQSAPTPTSSSQRAIDAAMEAIDALEAAQAAQGVPAANAQSGEQLGEAEAFAELLAAFAPKDRSPRSGTSPEPQLAQAQESSPLPESVQTQNHPDLASALRAAGRVAPSTDEVTQNSTMSRETSGSAAGAAQVPTQRSRRNGIVGRYGSAALLNPSRWKSGVESLRELTERKR